MTVNQILTAVDSDNPSIIRSLTAACWVKVHFWWSQWSKKVCKHDFNLQQIIVIVVKLSFVNVNTASGFKMAATD